jgi:hypothetical protein
MVTAEFTGLVVAPVATVAWARLTPGVVVAEWVGADDVILNVPATLIAVLELEELGQELLGSDLLVLEWH